MIHPNAASGAAPSSVATAPATRTYGLHLLADCYGADPDRLGDVGLLFETLCRLPELVGMRRIGFPHIAKFTEKEIAGISGVVMIVESHISIHTYVKKDFLSLDLYSCRQFDHRPVIDHIRQTYRVAEMEVQVIERGRRFPVENLHD